MNQPLSVSAQLCCVCTDGKGGMIIQKYEENKRAMHAESIEEKSTFADQYQSMESLLNIKLKHELELS